MLIAGVDEVTEPVVDEFLGEGARLHVGVHIDFLDLEALVLQHGLNADDVRMYLAPGEGFDGGVDDVGAIVADLEDAGHGKTWTTVAVILDDDVGVLGLDCLGECTQQRGLSDTCHVLEADLLGTGSDDLISYL